MGTKIYNSDLTKELREGAKIQQSVDSTPSELAEKVIPVMEVNPRLLRRINIFNLASRTTTTGASVVFYTVPTGKQLFITHLFLQNMSDVTADNTIIKLTATINGAALAIAQLVKLSLTAYTESLNIPLETPLKVDDGSNILITNAFTAGASATSYGFAGYLVDNPTA